MSFFTLLIVFFVRIVFFIDLAPEPKLNKSQCLGGNVYNHYENIGFWEKTNIKCKIKEDGTPEEYELDG